MSLAFWYNRDEMDAELIAIGSELMNGRVANTNAASLARHLYGLSIRTLRQVVVADERPLIVEAIQASLGRADLIITTGGLGPTCDDITFEALALAIKRPLVRVPSVVRDIKAFYRRFHRPLQSDALRQADLPQGALSLPNPLGTAPGMWLQLKGQIVVALPGVPREMEAIFQRHVLPQLRRARPEVTITTHTIRTVGLVELHIQRALHALKLPHTVQVGLYPHLGAVDVTLTVSQPTRPASKLTSRPRRGRSSRPSRYNPRWRGSAARRGTRGRPSHHATPRILTQLERGLRRRLGTAVYGTNAQTLEAVVGQALLRRRATLAVAESCTGGLVSNRMTDVAGSSRYFLLSVVTYHNRMKQALLGVNASHLARAGAVSRVVARAMAQGVRRRAGSTMALAITGIAGPGGGSTRKPVGLVYIALATAHRTTARRYHFHGDRSAIKHQAAQAALNTLRLALQ